MLDQLTGGSFSMRYTKEFKLECVRKYQTGMHIDDPGGCKHSTFSKKVRNWIRIYDAMGEVGLNHKKPTRTYLDKLSMIDRVLDGESITGVALSNGIQHDLLSKWLKIYQRSGIDGLKLSHKRGRPPKMANKPKTKNQPKTQQDLERENEELRAENEYLKKLSALVQKRKDRQPKKK
jgi:transposase-like protein